MVFSGCKREFETREFETSPAADACGGEAKRRRGGRPLQFYPIAQRRLRVYRFRVKPATHVRSPPPRPLMVYDGDCHFCTLWVRRCQFISSDRVDYLPLQDPGVSLRFPDVPRDQFETAVQLIEPDGSVYGGAAALFRCLAYNPRRQRWFNIYNRCQIFAGITECAYRIVARNRRTFSALTRLIWGRHA
jgi:predicted DCC family thiol-disulfide oxidoreductase YuxK